MSNPAISPTREITEEERAAWVRLVAVAELLPGVLDAQLLRDARLTHFEYVVLMVLADAPGRTSRMTALASRTNATLARLSHVMRRLEERGLVERFPCPQDRRATNARLTDTGLRELVGATPGHWDTVRAYVLDRLDARDLDDLYRIAGKLLDRLDPEGRFTATGCQFSAADPSETHVVAIQAG